MKVFTIKAEIDKYTIELKTTDESYSLNNKVSDAVATNLPILIEVADEILTFFKLPALISDLKAAEPVVNYKGRLLLTTNKKELKSVEILKCLNKSGKKRDIYNNLFKIIKLLSVAIKKIEFKPTFLITEFEITLI